ncbi:hypothetical protein [Vibrio sp. 99K-1]|uniref:hypothetical protein n=1 Tax=Vibrio sp. 99K-1 TaxID=2607603 RepID=UPI00149329B5|nr:hypothetical protein [Vibrio sp. 99K-1]NOI88736.1 hypothetical protein [Vibrio sp. 99K-1]
MTSQQNIQNFRDLYMPLHPEYRSISPLYGVLWCNNEVAEKYYRFLGEDHPLGQLSRSLFYRTDLVEFDVSNDVKNPFTWFSPTTIAHVMVFMTRHNFTDTDTDTDTLYQYIRDETDFHNSIEKQHLLSSQIRQLCNIVQQQFENTKIQLATEESELLACETILKDQKKRLNQVLQKAENSVEHKNLNIQQSRAALTKLKGRKKELIKGKSGERKLQLININNEIKILEKNLNVDLTEAVHKAGLTSSMQEAQVNIENANLRKDEATLRASKLVDSFTENTLNKLNREGFEADFITQHLPFNKFHRYLPRRVQDYVNIHCAERDGLLSELYNLCRQLISGMQTAENNHDVFHLLNTSLWLKCKGDFENLIVYMSQLRILHPALFNEKFIDDTYFPDLCCEYYDREVHNRYFPPLCITKSCRPAPESKVSFSDCGESSLRNFINILVKNQSTSSFDAEILKKSGLVIDPSVIEFYEQNPNLERIRNQDVHSQWAEITSSLNKCDSNIKYLTPKKGAYCELAAGGKNMQRMLKALLGEEDLTSICKKISSVSGTEIYCDLSDFHPDRHDLEDFSNFIRLEFEGKYVFFWYFLKQHFRCSTTDLFNEEENYILQTLTKLNNDLKQQRLDRDQHRALLSFHLKEKPVPKVKAMFDELGMSLVGDEMTFLMLSKLNSIDSMFDFCMNVLIIPRLKHSSQVLATVTSIIKSISPHPVIYDQRKNLIERIRDIEIEPLLPIVNQWEKESLEKA